MSPGAALEALGRACVQQRGPLLALWLAVTAVLAGLAGAAVAERGLPLDFTPQSLFMDGGPEIERLTAIEAVFGRDDNDLVILLHGDLASPAAAAALAAMHAAAAGAPGVERVDSPVNAPVVDAADGALLVRVPWDDAPPAAALARLAAEPVWRRLLVSPDGDTAALRIRIDRRLERVADLEPALREVLARVEAVPLPGGVERHRTGVPWVRVEVVGLMRDNQLVFLPVVASLFAVTIVLLFRRVRLGLMPLFAVLVADVWALSAIVALGLTMNVLSVLVPVLVVVIGVADGIHITARYREELALTPADAPGAMGRTLRAMALPCFFTTFTTAAGFLSLLVADTAAMRTFGQQASLALGICYVVILGLLPVFLAFVPLGAVPARGEARPGARPLGEGALAAIARLCLERPWAVLAGTVALTGAAALYARAVGPNSRLLEMYPPGTPTHTAVHLAQAELSGVIPVFAHLEGPPGSQVAPEQLARVAALEAWMRASPLVGWTSSPAARIGALHQSLGGDGPLPGTPELVAQELLLAEIAGDAPLDGVLDPSQAQARVLALVADAGGREVLAFRRDFDAEAARIFAGTGQRVVLTGDGIMAALGVDKLIRDLLWGLLLVFGICAGVFAWITRSARLTLIALVPNLVPLAFTLAALRVIGADLQTSNIVSFTVAVGLAVDDTIHFLSRYGEERARGHGIDDAIRRTLAGSGHAMVLTSVLLVVGFGVLGWSDLTSTRHFGILSAVTMVAALLGDLFLLPALLRLGLPRGAAPASAGRP